MNLFLPGGYQGAPELLFFGPQGIPEHYPLKYSWGQGGNMEALGQVTKDPLALSRYNLQLPLSPFISVSVYYGITTYLYGSVFGSVPYVQTERLAVHDGVVKLSVQGPDGKIIAAGESPFFRNTFKTEIVLKDLNNGYEAGSNYKLRWQYFSESNRPFGDSQFNSDLNTWGLTLVNPNQSLIAKTYNIGQQINYGPEVIVTQSANLTEAEIINVRSALESTVSSFANIEIDAELNLRAAINANAAIAADLLGPIQLSCAATGAVAISATSTSIVAMSAAPNVTSSSRVIPYIGTTILLQASATATAATKPTQSLLVSSRVSGMTLYVNLETREFITSPVLLIPITQMYFTRRDIEAIDVKFVRNGQVVPLSYGATGQLGIKSEFDGAMLALDSSWAEKGEGANIVYQFSINLNTEEIDDLFVTDDETSVTAKVELSWTEGGTINTTLPCAAIILNDVLRGTEGAPTPATVADYFDIRSDDDSVWRVTVDDSGVLTAQKQ